jgi:hypothetical protein
MVVAMVSGAIYPAQPAGWNVVVRRYEVCRNQMRRFEPSRRSIASGEGGCIAGCRRGG